MYDAFNFHKLFPNVVYYALKARDMITYSEEKKYTLAS